MRWAVEMAWTPRRVQSLSWATAESERESGHGGELEKLSVSIISQEQMDPKNAIILSFRSYYISVLLTELWADSAQVTHTQKVDRQQKKKALRDHMMSVEL